MEGMTVSTQDSEECAYKGKTGLRRLWNATRYSFAGLGAAIRHEDAFRVELVLALVLIPVALLSSVDPLSKALLVGSVLLVLIVELINSAIEATVDRISVESHRLAKRAKDIGSAAVFVSLLNAASIWAIIFLM